MASWTIGSVGDSPGPSSGDRHKPDGQMDFTPTWEEARQDVSYEHDFHKTADVPTAWGRVDVPDPAEGFGIPDPGCGHAGMPVNFSSVGVRPVDHGMDVLDGKGVGSDHMPETLD